MSLLFEGMDFRSFKFDFQLMARNEQESKTIHKIIKAFKLAMHPGEHDAGQAKYWTYPDNIDIALYSPSNKWMFNLMTCVITGMDINYAGSGIPSFFMNTGAPVDIRLSITFKEQEVLTKEMIDQGY